jgi:hypothetical protein
MEFMKILKQPNVCALTKNAMVFELEASNQFATPKIYPKLNFTFTGVFVVGLYFEFSFTNPRTKTSETVRFKTVNTLIDENDVRAYPASLSLYTDSLISDLQKIKLLSSYYEINRIAAGEIEIVAKYPLEELIPDSVSENISDEPLIGFSYSILEAFNLPIEREGYQMKALIYYNDPGINFTTPTDFELISIQTLTVDEDGKCFIDVSEILDGKIESEWDEIPLPPYQVPEVGLFHFKTPNLRQYYVVFKEYWDEEVQEFSVQSSKLFCHWGGISTDDEIAKDAINHILTAKKFLTWIPSGKHINKGQEDFLYFMNGPVEKTWRLRINIFTENPLNTQNLVEITLKPFQTFGFYANVDKYIEDGILFSAVGSNLVRYNFEIFEYNLITSEFETVPADTFQFYYEDYCTKKYILYFNSFGLAESFSTHNEWEETINVSKEIASRGLLYNDSNLRNKTFIFNSVHQNSIVMQSSLMRREEVRRLQTMLLSTYTFVLEEKRWIPVIVETKKAKVWNNSIFTQYLEMEMIKANSSDRASFFEILPNLLVSKVDYSIRFDLVLNNFKLDVISDLSIFDKTGSLVKTLVFDDVDYNFVSEADADDWHINQLVEGVYSYSFTVTDFNGVSKKIQGVFEYLLEKFDYVIGGTGDVEITLGATTSPLANVYIGLNNITTDSTISFEDIKGTEIITHPFGTTTGFKYCKFVSPTFKDVNYFTSNGNDFLKLDIQRFYNIQNLLIQNGNIEDKLYLNKLQLLQNILIKNVPITEVEIGYLKSITTFAIENCDLDEDAMESLITEFWNFRKMYGHTVNIFLTGMGAVNGETTALINGTGIYAGDGLLDNNFLVTITP